MEQRFLAPVPCGLRPCIVNDWSLNRASAFRLLHHSASNVAGESPARKQPARLIRIRTRTSPIGAPRHSSGTDSSRAPSAPGAKHTPARAVVAERESARDAGRRRTLAAINKCVLVSTACTTPGNTQASQANNQFRDASMRRCCLNRVESLLADYMGTRAERLLCAWFPRQRLPKAPNSWSTGTRELWSALKAHQPGTGLVPAQTTRALGIHAAVVGRPKLQQEVRDRRRNIPMKTPMDSKLNRQSSPHRQRHEMPRVSNLLEPVVALEVREGVPALAGEVVFAVDQVRESLFGAASPRPSR